MNKIIILAFLIALNYAAPQKGLDSRRANPAVFCEGYYAGIKHAQQTGTQPVRSDDSAVFCKGFYEASGLTEPRFDGEENVKPTTTSTTAPTIPVPFGYFGSSGIVAPGFEEFNTKPSYEKKPQGPMTGCQALTPECLGELSPFQGQSG